MPTISYFFAFLIVLFAGSLCAAEEKCSRECNSTEVYVEICAEFNICYIYDDGNSSRADLGELVWTKGDPVAHPFLLEVPLMLSIPIDAELFVQSKESIKKPTTLLQEKPQKHKEVKKKLPKKMRYKNKYHLGSSYGTRNNYKESINRKPLMRGHRKHFCNPMYENCRQAINF